jgi:class 3 adenylate cyclase
MAESEWLNASLVSHDTHRGIWMSIVAAICLAVYFQYGSLSFLADAEEWYRDVRIGAFTPDEEQHKDIIIVGVNEHTLDQFTYRSPLNRVFLSNLIQKLDNAGAKAIGVDFLLDTVTTPEEDNVLRATIANAKSVVMPIWIENSTVLPYWNVDFEGETERRAKTLKSFLGEKPSGIGEVHKDRSDSIVRRFRTIWNEDGNVKLHFPAALAKAMGYNIEESTEFQRIDWHGRPRLEEDGYKPPFRVYPAHHVLNVLPDVWFKDKIILVGPVLSDADLHNTALTAVPWLIEENNRTPGIFIHAHVLAQLIEGRSLTDIHWFWRLVQALGVIAIGIAISMLRIPLWSKVLIGTVVVIGQVIIGILIFRAGGNFVPVLPAQLAFALAVGLTTLFMGRQERQLRAYIRSAFSKFVPPAVVARLESQPGALSLGGERREITLIFTDLAGFTTTSESLSPTEVGTIITDYFDGLSSIIIEHGGTIDKFLGDGSMSFFGAPEASADDAVRAIHCTLDMLDFEAEFRARWKAQNIELGRTRIGVHTGVATVGNFGGQERFDYTALGDVVNTSARLEAANKLCGSLALVSQETVDQAPECFFRPVGDLIMPGKSSAIRTYEPLREDAHSNEAVAEYKKAFQLLEAEDEAAVKAFGALTEKYPDDKLIAFHATRLQAGETGRVIHIKSK